MNFEDKIIKDGMTIWTESALKREIAIYQGHLVKAIKEGNAGNSRMLAYAEAYADKRDNLQFLLQKLRGWT